MTASRIYKPSAPCSPHMGKKPVRSYTAASFPMRTVCCVALRGGVQFDAMFLDILMPSLTGIEAARELRQSGNSTDLIFLTVSRDFALDAFSVKAKDYLIKPLSETMFFQLLDDLKAKLDENETILIAGKKSFRRLRPDRIEYCEVRGHSIFWNLRSGAVLESRGSMEEAEELLSSSGFFLRVHRSYLVNQYCIASFVGRAVP